MVQGGPFVLHDFGVQYLPGPGTIMLHGDTARWPHGTLACDSATDGAYRWGSAIYNKPAVNQAVVLATDLARNRYMGKCASTDDAGFRQMLRDEKAQCGISKSAITAMYRACYQPLNPACNVQPITALGDPVLLMPAVPVPELTSMPNVNDSDLEQLFCGTNADECSDS